MSTEVLWSGAHYYAQCRACRWFAAPMRKSRASAERDAAKHDRSHK